MFTLTRQEQLIVLLLTSGLLIGTAVLIVRGRPEPFQGEPLDYTFEIPERTEGVSNNPVSSDDNVEPWDTKNASEKVNINTAAPGELEKLPGIGPVLANRIIEYRETVGLFSDEKEIIKVNGIGNGKYCAIEEYITVE